MGLSRTRRIVLACAVLGIGGYTSYKVWNSSYISQKRKRVAELLDTLSRLVEALSMTSEDVRSFLFSESDEVPQFVKQSLKVAHLREFQDALTLFSCSVSRGMVSGITRSGSAILLDDLKEESMEKSEQVVSQNTLKSKQYQGLPERLVQKLFTEAGKGFASAVLGSVARNIVMAALEGLEKLNSSNRSAMEWDLRGLSPDDVFVRSERPNVLFDLACSSKGKGFIAESIQVFVSTAVAVYLEKTKDINFCEQVVAGITKPAHRPGVDELLKSVCNGAVETFVRTSHGVLFARSSNDVVQTQQVPEQPVEELAKNFDAVTRSELANEDSGSRSTPEVPPAPDTSSVLHTDSLRALQPEMMLVTTDGGSPRNVLSIWVNGITMALAVPSNRKLLIDVAGTVTSEAVYSFFDVFMGLVAPSMRGKPRLRHVSQHNNIKEDEEISLSSKLVPVQSSYAITCTRVIVFSKEMMARSLVILTIFLAIIIHVFVDVHALQPVLS